MAADRTPKRRLGRGLDALLGSASAGARTADASALQQLPIAEIGPNPLQPRREFRSEELEELRQSLKSSGLLQPITVRPHPSGIGYQLIAGERRWRAAQSLGWDRISAVVHQADDSTLLALALVENLQRSDLNPLEEAEGYQRLSQEFGLPTTKVAELTGKSRSTVANLVRLLELPASVKALVRSGELTAGQVRPLLALGDPGAIISLAEEIRKRKLPARAVEARTGAGKRRQKASPRAKEKPDAGARAVENDLRRHLQTDVKITARRGGGGDITMRFYSNEDLERLLERMGVQGEE
ncbi:MAG TPA: ParB/RepB/Spo0J family partition protein [Gemmatimonadaceae bacterium]|nr:ParB/RepB/Spo0J family partition protein [Gemmatimonadaceae bacterium]